MLSKKELRLKLIHKRKSISSHEVIEKSSNICEQIINHKKYIQAEVIYLYAAVNNEVSLDLLAKTAIAHNKTIAYPKVNGDYMSFYSVTSPDELVNGYRNILEPGITYPAPEPDLIIVPGVAFDTNGYRLGYGGGFYDRFLSRTKGFSIGVSYDFQLLEEIPYDQYDIPLNTIIYNK